MLGMAIAGVDDRRTSRSAPIHSMRQVGAVIYTKDMLLGGHVLPAQRRRPDC